MKKHIKYALMGGAIPLLLYYLGVFIAFILFGPLKPIEYGFTLGYVLAILTCPVSLLVRMFTGSTPWSGTLYSVYIFIFVPLVYAIAGASISFFLYRRKLRIKK